MQHTLRLGFSRFTSLVRSHDDLPAFNAAYWVLTFLAAMLFNAGAFILLIAMHMVLDVYKYREIYGRNWSKVAEGVARESLIDVSVVALGIAFSVYCHTALPLVAGLRGIVRTEIVVLNALVQVATKTHVLHGFLTILADIHGYLQTVHPRMDSWLSPIDIVALASLVVSVALTLLAPWILGLDAGQIARLADEILVPWRM